MEGAATWGAMGAATSAETPGAGAALVCGCAAGAVVSPAPCVWYLDGMGEGCQAERSRTLGAGAVVCDCRVPSAAGWTTVLPCSDGMGEGCQAERFRTLGAAFATAGAAWLSCACPAGTACSTAHPAVAAVNTPATTMRETQDCTFLDLLMKV